MTEWFKREPLPDPATHALVVGVSRYQFLPANDGDPSPNDHETFGLRQAKTPATSAWKFANWLKGSYNNPTAPLGTVRLLLSPSDWEKQNVPALAALPAEVLPATRENVAAAVDEWFEACNASSGNVAILYASGHGIQISKDDGGIVLLEDFAKERSVLTHSLDVPAVRAGMAGTTMAQQQFYFVDACEVRPTQAIDFQSMGAGVNLPNPFEGAARCSAVYYSASPSTEALGEPGNGTLFVQALIECLELTAVDTHTHENGWWVVTTSSLMRALPKRVGELARSFNSEQTGTTGGQLAEVIFHVLPEAPKVPVTLELDPEAVIAGATARLWDGVATSVFEGERFTPKLTKSVPAGQYVLTVEIKPPVPGFEDEIPAFPVPALPPEFVKKLAVPPA
jgi:hypothetical protein